MFIGVCKMCGIGYYRSSHDNGMSYGMRLKEIKLAGFKSFVDPTTVVLPGSRVAVVGPNGCGKSNIIDAVRWVMGESSARQLRGEALTDVIFNGSNARQPTSLASVELLFDNREEGVGGKFASYARTGHSPRSGSQFAIHLLPQRHALRRRRHRRRLSWHRLWAAQLLDHRARHDHRSGGGEARRVAWLFGRSGWASPNTASAVARRKTASATRRRTCNGSATSAPNWRASWRG